MLGRIRITEIFSTTAPPAAVWAALEAAPRWPQVQSDLIEAHIEPNGVLAAGATIRTTARPGTAAVDMSYRVVEAVEPSRLTIEAAKAGHFRSRTEYRIEPEGTGTRLTISAAAEPLLWLHKFTTQLARGWYTRQLSENLRARTGPLLALAEEIAAQT